VDRQKLPRAGHTAQLDAATIVKGGAGADDQVTHSARHQYFAGARVARIRAAMCNAKVLGFGMQRFSATDGLRPSNVMR
jgi:hypothetical protein